MKKIVLRADGNHQSGLGHLYRMFALVEMLKLKCDCVILTRSDSTLEVIPEAYDLRLLPPGLSIADEPAWLKEHYPSLHYILIADGYHFDAGYQKAIKGYGFRLVYIDDLANSHMYADLVINHSPSASEPNYKAEPYTKFALGTHYALLRPSFLEAAKKRRHINKISAAFVCFGGADPFQLTGKVVKALLKFKQLRTLHVICGAASVENELSGASGSNCEITYYRNVKERDLLEIMLASDIAIVPTSTVLFEACCVGMLVLSGYFVDNQEAAYHSFVEKGLIKGIGNFLTCGAEKLEEGIGTLIRSDHERCIHQQKLYFDGNQGDRIIDVILNEHGY